MPAAVRSLLNQAGLATGTGFAVWAGRVSDVCDGASAGYAGPSYLHVQATAALEWVINHNFGSRYRPVVVYDQAGSLVDADVRSISENQVRIYFSVPASGFARVS